jgi:hypothetical protein
MPFSSRHWMAICRRSTCLNRFQASHKLYSVSRRLNRNCRVPHSGISQLMRKFRCARSAQFDVPRGGTKIYGGIPAGRGIPGRSVPRRNGQAVSDAPKQPAKPFAPSLNPFPLRERIKRPFVLFRLRRRDFGHCDRVALQVAGELHCVTCIFR